MTEIYAAMIEATRLTREGRLNEATLLIQRTLGLGHTPTRASTDVVDEPELIEERFRLTAEPAAAPEASTPMAVRNRGGGGTPDGRRAAGRRSDDGPSRDDPPPRGPSSTAGIAAADAAARQAAAARHAGRTSSAPAGPAAGPGGGPVDRGDPYQRGRDPRLQTLYPQRVSRAGHAAGRDAPRLYPRPRRFRRRHRA